VRGGGGILEGGPRRVHEEGPEDELEAAGDVLQVQEEGLNFGLRQSPGRTRAVHSCGALPMR